MPAPELTLPVTCLVLFAGTLHATWNAIASAIPDKVAAFGLIGLAQGAIGAVCLPLAGLPRTAAFGYLAASALIHVAYNRALMSSYRLGAFGQAYPLARGSAPILVGIGAWFLADEHLSGLQIAGIATIATGLIAIVFAPGRLSRRDAPAVTAALLTGVTIAGYTIVDGLGVRHADNPLGYISLLFLLQAPMVVALAGAMLRGRFDRRALAAHAPAGIVAGIISVLAYGIVIWAQTHGPLALISALRETSVISAAMISTVLFHEPFARRRIGPSVAVVLGIVLVNL